MSPNSSIEEIYIVKSTFKPFYWNGRLLRIRRIKRGRFILRFIILIIGTIVMVLGSNGLPGLISLFRAEEPASKFIGFLGLAFYLLVSLSYVFLYIETFLGRIRDINLPWYSFILALIPFLNIIFFIILMIIPGNESDNEYGPPPLSGKEIRKIRIWYKERES